MRYQAALHPDMGDGSVLIGVRQLGFLYIAGCYVCVVVRGAACGGVNAAGWLFLMGSVS